MARKSEAVHPGMVLKHDFMAPHDLSASRLGRIILVPTNRLTDIIRGRRGISADTALRLARHFGTQPAFWLELQNAYDLDCAKAAAKKDIKRIPRRDTA